MGKLVAKKAMPKVASADELNGMLADIMKESGESPLRSYERRVVVWSGGLDSTLLLLKEAARTSGTVVAITVDACDGMPTDQMVAQRKAQAAFLKWAADKGLHIEHKQITLSITGGLQPHTNQALMWFSLLMPYVGDGDTLLFGYVAGDWYWHERHHYDVAFEALMKAKGRTAKIEYPLESVEKAEVLEQLIGTGLPSDCWWTCEEPTPLPKRKTKTALVGGLPCGVCKKCKEVSRAWDVCKQRIESRKAPPRLLSVQNPWQQEDVEKGLAVRTQMDAQGKKLQKLEKAGEKAAKGDKLPMPKSAKGGMVKGI